MCQSLCACLQKSAICYTHLVNSNQIKNPIDLKIAKKLIDAQRDWRTSIPTLFDFIQVFELEVNDQLTKSNLNKLMDRYQRNIPRYAWEIESLSYTLDIFEWTTKEDLKETIIDLVKRINVN